MDSPPTVPFASWGWKTQQEADGALEQLLARFGDRMVRIAEDTLGEELDARIARIQMHPNEAGVDPFGFDPTVARYALAVAAFLHRFYFRSQVFGAENIPSGRALVIANHSGQIPMDGLLIGASLMLDAEPPRFARSMVERWSAELPFVSVLFPRCGQVVGSPDNARRLLENDETLVVFPEGARGISKTFDKRYQLERFGLGFMRLALETQTPIVPVGVVGGEEQLVSVANLESVGRVFGMPSFPVIPQLFMGMPFPLPTRYRIHFGEPLRFQGDPDDDDTVVQQKVDAVMDAIRGLLAQGLARRRAIFW